MPHRMSHAIINGDKPCEEPCYQKQQLEPWHFPSALPLARYFVEICTGLLELQTSSHSSSNDISCRNLPPKPQGYSQSYFVSETLVAQTISRLFPFMRHSKLLHHNTRSNPIAASHPPSFLPRHHCRTCRPATKQTRGIRLHDSPQSPR